MLGALVLVLQDPPRTAEPARGRPDLATACEIQADPDCAVRGTPLLSGVEEALVRMFEPGDRVVVATEHEGADREQLEVFRGEAFPLVHERQRIVRLEPSPLRVGVATSLELFDSIPHAAAHCPTNNIADAQIEEPRKAGLFVSRPVSRILSRVTIPLGRPFPADSSGAPGSSAGHVVGACFALHRTGFG